MPEPRDFGWQLKPVESAATQMTRLPTGQFELTIDHDVIHGVTTDHLVWWFTHFFSLRIVYRGTEYPAYHLWHPLDHIDVAKVGGSDGPEVREGDRITLHEALQRDSDNEVFGRARVIYFRDDGFGMELRRGPLRIGRLLHRFSNVDGGVEYRSRLVAGLESGPLRPLVNRFVLRRELSEEKLRAWFRHNVEEVGCWENFLPELYERRDQGNLINLD